MPTSSDKSKINARSRENNKRSIQPKLGDFKRRGTGMQKEERASLNRRRQMDNIFENFRKDIEDTITPWSSSLWDLRFPSVFGTEDAVEEEEMMVRMPIFDMTDKGDRYELQVELPGIEKDKTNVTVTKDSIEISGEQSMEEQEVNKRKRYLYKERSYKSFYRNIPIPEEIISSKVTAKMNNGILNVELLKKTPTKLEKEEATKGDIK
jgi:HSP20 family protein